MTFSARRPTSEVQNISDLVFILSVMMMMVVVVVVVVMMMINRILDFYDHNCNYDIFDSWDDSDMHRSNDAA